MKVFCSYAHRGEDEKDIHRRMLALQTIFHELGLRSYCNLFDPDMPTLKDDGEILRDVVGKKLRDYDVVYVITTSERKSEGIAMEVGAALALGKKIYLAQHETAMGANTISKLADKQFIWKTEKELLERTKELFHEHNRAA